MRECHKDHFIYSSTQQVSGKISRRHFYVYCYLYTSSITCFLGSYFNYTFRRVGVCSASFFFVVGQFDPLFKTHFMAMETVNLIGWGYSQNSWRFWCEQLGMLLALEFMGFFRIKWKTNSQLLRVWVIARKIMTRTNEGWS